MQGKIWTPLICKHGLREVIKSLKPVDLFRNPKIKLNHNFDNNKNRKWPSENLDTNYMFKDDSQYE